MTEFHSVSHSSRLGFVCSESDRIFEWLQSFTSHSKMRSDLSPGSSGSQSGWRAWLGVVVTIEGVVKGISSFCPMQKWL